MLRLKRNVVFLLFSLVLLSSIVYAEQITGIGSVDKVLTYVFQLDITQPVGLKFVFSLLSFTVLFGVSEFVFRGWAKGIRFLLAALISIIAVMAIPVQLLATISQTYGAIFAFVMMGVPMLGGIYLLFGVLTEKTRPTYAAKVVIAGLLWYLFGVLAKDLPGVFGGALEIGKVLVGLGSFSAAVSAFFLFMTIYYIYKFFRPEPELEEDAAMFGRGAAAGGGWLWNKAKGLKNVAKAEEAFTIEELQTINKVKASVQQLVKTMGEEIGTLRSRLQAREITKEQMISEEARINGVIAKIIGGIVGQLSEVRQEARQVFLLARRSRHYSANETMIAALQQDTRKKINLIFEDFGKFRMKDIYQKSQEYGALRDTVIQKLDELYTELGTILAKIQSVEKE